MFYIKYVIDHISKMDQLLDNKKNLLIIKKWSVISVQHMYQSKLRIKLQTKKIFFKKRQKLLLSNFLSHNFYGFLEFLQHFFFSLCGL